MIQTEIRTALEIVVKNTLGVDVLLKMAAIEPKLEPTVLEKMRSFQRMEPDAERRISQIVSEDAETADFVQKNLGLCAAGSHTTFCFGL